MFRLVQANAAATGQGNHSEDAPIRLLHLGAGHAFSPQQRNECTQIITHQIQHRTQHFMSPMMLSGACIDRVNGGLGRRHAENQPAMPNIDGRKFQNVTKESPIRFRISAMEQEMRADDHAAEYIRTYGAKFDQFRRPS
jgi:hypothetical protein